MSHIPSMNGFQHPGAGDFAFSPVKENSKLLFQTPIAQYKRIPIHPLVSPAVDHHHSNHRFLRSPCQKCFPMVKSDKAEYFVDLLQFSQFSGIPHEILPGVSPPRRWMADIRYTLSTPLPHSYPSVWKDLINSERINRAIEYQLNSDPTATQSSLRKKISRCFTEIRATLSKIACKICAYVLSKVFKRLMSQLLVSPNQMAQIQEAHKSCLPIVYLPLHRSHLDYLLITWTAWHFSLPLPHIASGDNLNLSGFGWLLRATGAFFIRRRLNPEDDGGKDALYRAVLHSYIEELLKKGLPIEFFLEGTRSRFGKSLMPKHGLISNVVEAAQQGSIKDCYLVPVSYTYDQVAEGLFLEELMGVPKIRESFIGVVRGVLKSFGVAKRCGTVRMHFGHPVLLSDHLKSLTEALRSMDSPPRHSLSRLPQSYSYRELVPWHHAHAEKIDQRRLIRAIGYHVVYEAQAQVSISLVSVVSALLMCKFRQGISMDILASDVGWLCSLIIESGSDIVGWRSGETDGKNAVEYALPFIRECIERDVDDKISPINAHRHMIQLAYSKNALVPLFALKGAIALAVLSSPNPVMSYVDISYRTKEICDLLEFEVIFCKPCQPLELAIEQQLKEWTSNRPVLRRKLATDEFVMSATEELHKSEFEILDEAAHTILSFYSSIMLPFLQSLYMCATKLKAEGEHKKVESINSDSFKNCLRLMRDRRVIRDIEPMIEVISPDIVDDLRNKVFGYLKIYS